MASSDVLFAAANGHDHDTFVFHPGYSGHVTVYNFVGQVGDQVELRGRGIANLQQRSPYVATSNEGRTMLVLGGGTPTLEGVHGGLQSSWLKFT
jgi:hypothetical protein